MKYFLTLITALIILFELSSGSEKVSLKDECYKTFGTLTETLLSLQVKDRANSNYGALMCPECKLFHTRAAEAVYPLVIRYKHSNEKKYLESAIELGNWLIKQQNPGGEWLETPWTWTGTTADQLLMMSLSFPVIQNYLDAKTKEKWKNSIQLAADFLVKNMSPDFATINYCATTPATLAATNLIFPDDRYILKARELSRQVLSKMNIDGFIEGEAARVGKVKYGIDVAYEFDMSFWGLLMYATFTGDTLVENKISSAVLSHLNLVYPDGIIDGSWGTRCYKWTTLGSKTADGSQILFSLLSKKDARYRTAAIRNLEYLRKFIVNGMVVSGPHYEEIFNQQPCVYSTFARAKNLALAVEYGDQTKGELSHLPSENTGMLKVYPSVNIAVARTENILTTISAYQYVDYQNWGQGRYSQFPSGGSACNVWIKDFGLFQTSSPTKYIRGEVIHMPDVKEPIRPHTPRIEYSDSGKLITNLYDRKGVMLTNKKNKNDISVSVSGEMSDENHLPNGVSYTITHKLEKSSIQKSVILKYHDKFPAISVIEPVIFEEGMQVSKISDKKISIKYSKKEFTFELIKGVASFEIGEDKEHYWQPFPALRCFPIVLKVPALVNPFVDINFNQEIVYKFVVH